MLTASAIHRTDPCVQAYAEYDRLWSAMPADEQTSIDTCKTGKIDASMHVITGGPDDISDRYLVDTYARLDADMRDAVIAMQNAYGDDKPWEPNDRTISVARQDCIDEPLHRRPSP